MIMEFLTTVALVLVIEGILPLLCPECWRKTMSKLLEQQPRTLRLIGLITMLSGVVLLYFLRS